MDETVPMLTPPYFIFTQWMKHSRGVKLHVALDMNSWQVINIEVTNEKVHDSQKAIQLLEGVRLVGESRGLKVLCPIYLQER